AHDCHWRAGLETLPAGNEGVPDRRMAAAFGVHLLLRQVHGMERRFRLGRPLRLHLRGTGGVYFSAAAVASSRGAWKIRLGNWDGIDYGQRGDPVGVAGFLVAAGDLPDGDA